MFTEDGVLQEQDGTVFVQDDLDALLQVRCAHCLILPLRAFQMQRPQVLPLDIRQPLVNHPGRANLLEVCVYTVYHH